MIRISNKIFNKALYIWTPLIWKKKCSRNFNTLQSQKNNFVLKIWYSIILWKVSLNFFHFPYLMIVPNTFIFNRVCLRTLTCTIKCIGVYPSRQPIWLFASIYDIIINDNCRSNIFCSLSDSIKDVSWQWKHLLQWD